MARTWVVRTDYDHLDDVILPSLDAGELRQGWSYEPDQDLNVIGPLVYDRGNSGLNADQKATWRRVRRFWPDHWDPVSIGDRVLLPKVPEWGHWRLVEVVGDYRFDPDPSTNDHGHILPVKTLLADIASSNVAVGAGLQRTMRSQGPMWNIDRLNDEIDRVIDAGSMAATPNGPTERLAAVLDKTLDDLQKNLRNGFRANALEEPVRRLLQQVFPGATVVKTAGAGEHGADFTISASDRFGHERTTVVQLKDHPDVLSDLEALAQVKRAFDWYAPVSAAVVLSTAASEDPTFARARDELSARLGIPVTAVLGRQLARWFLAHLESVAAD